MLAGVLARMFKHRLNLFGIAGAATLQASCTCLARGRLNLFGIAGAATAQVSAWRMSDHPPQSLWNRGCCHVRDLMDYPWDIIRLNLFGIAGAATSIRRHCQSGAAAASISLESRVLPLWAFATLMDQ